MDDGRVESAGPTIRADDASVGVMGQNSEMREQASIGRERSGVASALQMRARGVALPSWLDAWNVGIFLVGSIVLVTLSIHLTRKTYLTGDEPWYLLQVYSLLHYHSFSLTQAIHDRQVYSMFLGNTPNDHAFNYAGHGDLVLWYLPGYAMAIAPFYAIRHLSGVVAFQSVVAALTGALLFDEARRIFNSLRVALIAWVVYMAMLPMLLYAGQIFPSSLGTFPPLLGFVLISRWLPDARGKNLIGISITIGLIVFVLPWIHFRYAFMALFLVAAALVVLRRRLFAPWATRETREVWAAAVTIVGLAGVGFGLIAIYCKHYYGTLTPINGVPPDFAHPQFGAIVPLFAYSFFSQQAGLIPWAPIDLLVVPGLLLLLWQHRRAGLYTGLFLAVQLGTYLLAIVQPEISPGDCFPARFTVECSPFFALCVAGIVAGEYPRGLWSTVQHALRRLTARAGSAAQLARLQLATRGGTKWGRAAVTAGGLSLWLVGLVFLLWSGWISVVAQRDPKVLYPSPPPPRVRLVEEYPNLLPAAWWDLFPKP